MQRIQESVNLLWILMFDLDKKIHDYILERTPYKK